MTTFSSAGLALWARAAAGDASAVEAVMELAGKIVRQRVSGFLAGDVDELTGRLQEVVMARLHNKEVDLVRVSLHGWLRSQLLAVRSELLRERRRHRCAPLDEQAAGHGPAPSHRAEFGEMRSALDGCLGKLPEKHRSAVLARYGFARIPGGRNPTTLRVWRMRGLRSLHECMKRQGFDNV